MTVRPKFNQLKRRARAERACLCVCCLCAARCCSRCLFVLSCTCVCSPPTLQGIDSAAQAELARRLLSAGLCFHGYQQLSYMILSRVTPVTHSIGNCVKRVVVIVASVIAFNHPLSTQNAIGTGLALFGVFLYSQAKRRFKDKPKAA